MILNREKLTQQIERNFFTNEKLAQVAGLGRNTINNARNGANITPRTLEKLCKALNCSVDDIIQLKRGLATAQDGFLFVQRYNNPIKK